MFGHRGNVITFHSLHIAKFILDKDWIEVNTNPTKEEKIMQTQYWSNIIRFHPFTCLFVILHKEITMASPLSVYVPYITWVWQYTRNEQIFSTTYPHRGSQNKKRGSDIYTKGDNQNDRERERKEVKENQSYLQIVKLSTVWTFDNVRVKKRWNIKNYIKCVFWNIKTIFQHN